MLCIIPGVYISNQEAASQEEILTSNHIAKVISVGCKPTAQFDGVEYIAYTNLLDTPETKIISVLLETNKIIDSAIKEKHNILVHCVYGQSRSASVIVSYLMFSGMTLVNSLKVMIDKNPTTCINPGFLAQLYFLSNCSTESIEFKHFMSGSVQLSQHQIPVQEETSIIGKRKVDEYDAHITTTTSSSVVDTINSSNNKDIIICRNCKYELGMKDNILTHSIDPTKFIEDHIDYFYKGYQPKRSKHASEIVKLPYKGIIAVYPTVWMEEFIKTQQNLRNNNDNNKNNNDNNNNMKSIDINIDIDNYKNNNCILQETSLICPGCTAEVGNWSPERLNLCGIYNLCDLFALYDTMVRIKRYRHINLK